MHVHHRVACVVPGHRNDLSRPMPRDAEPPQYCNMHLHHSISEGARRLHPRHCRGGKAPGPREAVSTPRHRNAASWKLPNSRGLGSPDPPSLCPPATPGEENSEKSIQAKKHLDGPPARSAECPLDVSFAWAAAWDATPSPSPNCFLSSFVVPGRSARRHRPTGMPFQPEIRSHRTPRTAPQGPWLATRRHSHGPLIALPELHA